MFPNHICFGFLPHKFLQWMWLQVQFLIILQISLEQLLIVTCGNVQLWSVFGWPFLQEDVERTKLSDEGCRRGDHLLCTAAM